MNEQALKSTIKPRDPATQPFRVVLHQMGSGWATHCENVTEKPSGGFQSKKNPDFYWGHYHGQDYAAALKDYKERCDKYQLEYNLA